MLEGLTSRWGIVASFSAGTIDNSSENEPPLSDFDDGANAIWSLFFKQAKIQDEAQFRGLMETMDGGLVFVRVSPCVLHRFY